MSISSQTLTQARESLVSAHQQRLVLMGQVKEQNRKISDLEREVQRQAGARSQAEQALSDAYREIEALRTQIPDAATISAHDALVEYLTSPSDLRPELRVAA